MCSLLEPPRGLGSHLLAGLKRESRPFVWVSVSVVILIRLTIAFGLNRMRAADIGDGASLFTLMLFEEHEHPLTGRQVLNWAICPEMCFITGLVGAVVANYRRHQSLNYGILGLLLGLVAMPLMLVAVATKRPTVDSGWYFRVILLISGFLTAALWIGCNLLFPVADLFGNLSLSLPNFTQSLVSLSAALGIRDLLPVWIILLLAFPPALVVTSEFLSRNGWQRVRTWGHLLLIGLSTMLFCSVSAATFLPIHALIASM